MMDLEYKQNNWIKFIDRKFSETTWGQLMFLYRSFKMSHDYINAELDEIIECTSLNQIHRFRFTHVLLRLMSNIETLLAMLFVFHKKDLRSFGKIMLRYNQKKHIEPVIGEILDGLLEKKSLVFGFPEIKYLDISKKYKQFVYDVFIEATKEYVHKIKGFIEFYQNNRSAYGKLKHGLMFTFEEMIKTRDKVLITYDRYGKDEFFRGAECYRPPVNPSPPELDWFNLVSLIRQDVETFRWYRSLSEDILRISHYIIRNYLNFGTNCGEDYLPKGIEEMLQSKKDLVKLEKYKNIKNLIEPRMHLPSLELNVVVSFEGEAAKKLTDHWKSIHVSNHWYPPKK